MGNKRLYSDKLLGLSINCNIPYCPHQAKSTGWIEKRHATGTADWYAEYICEDDGVVLSWTASSKDLVDSVVAENSHDQ